MVEHLSIFRISSPAFSSCGQKTVFSNLAAPETELEEKSVNVGIQGLWHTLGDQGTETSYPSCSTGVLY